MPFDCKHIYSESESPALVIYNVFLDRFSNHRYQCEKSTKLFFYNMWKSLYLFLSCKHNFPMRSFSCDSPISYPAKFDNAGQDIGHIWDMSSKSPKILNCRWKTLLFALCIFNMWRSELFKNEVKGEKYKIFRMMVYVLGATCAKAPSNWYKNVWLGYIVHMIWWHLSCPRHTKDMSRIPNIQ